jgi:hypothetical protein
MLEDDGGFGFDMGGMIGPYGVHYASGSQLYDTFVKPFVDVFDVAKGKTKEVTARLFAMGKVIFETLATTILPWLTSDYEDIFAEEKQAIDKIRSEYSEVYAATWEAFHNKDVALAAFFCYPGIVLTGALAHRSPITTLNVLSTISGGEFDTVITQIRTAYMSSGIGHKGGHKYSNTANMMFNSLGGDKIEWMGESRLYEDESKSKKTKKEQLADIVTNKKLVKKFLSTPHAQRLQSESRAIVRHTLTTIFERAQGITSAKTLEDVQKIVGKHLKGIDELKKMKPEERQQMEPKILDNLKASMKELYVKNLEAQAKDAISAGIPNNSGFIKMYADTIHKIKTL